jgi:hypothetical protein
MSTRREQQAWNDGRNAYRQGHDIGTNPRKSPEQRTAWRNGYEHERRLDLAEEVTPERREEAAAVAKRLKEWAQKL